MNSNTSIPSNTSTPINPAGNNTSAPIVSPECEATLSKYFETCAAQEKALSELGSKIPNATQQCLPDSCTPKQKQDFLKLTCPTANKFYACIEPGMDCFMETMPEEIRGSFSQSVSECKAFSEKSGNTTTGGNGKNNTTNGNGKNVASLFSILAFSLFL